jgi:hypothetical protein
MLHAFLSNFAAACQAKGAGIVPTWYKYLESETIANRCSPKVAFPNDIGPILLAVFEILLFLGGVIAVIFVIVGGFQYLISQGEPDKMKNARTTIMNAVIGLIITVLSSAIVSLIAKNVT